MYQDVTPCEICGSPVELRPHDPPTDAGREGPVGEPDGVVGTADPTMDDRVCTDPACPSNR